MPVLMSHSRTTLCRSLTTSYFCDTAIAVPSPVTVTAMMGSPARWRARLSPVRLHNRIVPSACPEATTGRSPMRPAATEVAAAPSSAIRTTV
ncbi:hypothetical protein E1295_47680 [Nonomuraea mesophila]|uniref:Uncharacterized protein n=1 Tax=Nonomuraea mesophila TaxID=2530382 RepID=A0A4R5DX69_9ACTN|nr:hypothetical protein E1295_47680 [Nonomuraea mesophila]